MHPLLIVASLFPATALAVVGFFILYAAGRSEGMVRRIGNILGAWMYILAVLVIVVGIVGSVVGGGRPGYFHERMMRHWHPGWAMPDGPPPALGPAAPAPGAAPTPVASPAPAASPAPKK